MSQNCFSIEDELRIAKNILPLPADNDWLIMPVGDLIYSTKYGYWLPETDITQWKELAEWCLDRGLFPAKGLHFFFGGDDPYIFIGELGMRNKHPANAEIECYGVLHSGFDVSAFTRTDCMKAAVLAFIGGCDGQQH